MEIKKLILLSWLLSLSWFVFGETITIGNGNTLHQGLPFEPLARFSYTQQIFLSTEIGQSGLISAVGFNYNVSSTSFYAGNKLLKVYLGHCMDATLSGWIPTSQMTLVYEGIIAQDWFDAGLPGSGWFMLPLQIPFEYDGNQNLILAVDENTDASGNSSDDFFCRSLSTTRAIHFQHMSTNPDPDNPPSTFTLKSYVCNLRLVINSASNPQAPSNLYGYHSSGANLMFWQAPASGNVNVYRVNRNGSVYQQCSNTNFVDNAVLAGNSYSYTVQAIFTNSEVSPASNTITINVPSSGENTILYEGFEACAPFTFSIPGFTNLDMDGSPTWNWDIINFSHESEAMAWMVFCPSQTIPPLTSLQASSGNNLLVAMGSTTPPNNDWLISPRMYLGSNASLSFKARSYTSAYGLERLKLLISTTDANLASFTVLNPEPYYSVPSNWTNYQIDLGQYDSQRVYLAWQCVSLDAFALLLDEIKVIGTGGYVSSDDALATVPKLSLYPNPSSKHFCVKGADGIPYDLSVFNMRGQRIYSQKHIEDFASEKEGLNLSAGIYLIHISNSRYQRTLKQVILP